MNRTAINIIQNNSNQRHLVVQVPEWEPGHDIILDYHHLPSWMHTLQRGDAVTAKANLYADSERELRFKDWLAPEPATVE
jgi:hypothetical protein